MWSDIHSDLQKQLVELAINAIVLLKDWMSI